MFRLEVLHRDADRVEQALNNIGKIFNKRIEPYTCVFHALDDKNYIINADKQYLGTAFLRVHDLKVAYLTNNLGTQILFIERDGSSYSVSQIEFINWKQQSERAAKIELYTLMNIPQQDWIL